MNVNHNALTTNTTSGVTTGLAAADTASQLFLSAGAVAEPIASAAYGVTMRCVFTPFRCVVSVLPVSAERGGAVAADVISGAVACLAAFGFVVLCVAMDWYDVTCTLCNSCSLTRSVVRLLR